jgi:NADPH-dependent curcumin reductase CurA
MNGINRQIRLAARPSGLPDDSCWSHTEEPIPSPGPGEILVKIRYLSVDPAMRGWMRDRPSYVPPVEVGAVMRALTVGDVVASNNEAFPVGSSVAGVQGVQEYALSDGTDVWAADTALAPLPAWLNTLGIAGLTAYCGLVEVGKPEAGETVLVSGAAGSVGVHVGQIAKILGCRVVGIAGGPAKCAYLDELGFDGAIDYKSENLYAAIGRECPDGVDVFFDNVGGETLDAALAHINLNARVVICGAISQYNTTDIEGPKNYLALLIQRARMEGFIYFDYSGQWPSMLEKLAAWSAEGRLGSRDDIVPGGVEMFPEALLRLFSGDNFGKLMIEVG